MYEGDPFSVLGVRKIINAAGPQTRLSGGLMDESVSAAMAEASRHCVDMGELQSAASDLIASWTGAEAACVTGGGAAALMLGAAACMTGLDVSRMNRLPQTEGMPNEFIMSRSQRNMYDRVVRQAGGALVEVGIPDRFTGAGVRDADVYDFRSAVGPRTAAILWFAQRNSEPPLARLAELAREISVPLLVDAASQLPPKENLRALLNAGADLVAFSGGKAIGGPQASGFLAGRRDLVQAAVLQMMDHDLPPTLFRPIGKLFDGLELPTLPEHGIGRPAKAGKEAVIGLLTALRRYVEHDPKERSWRWREMCESIVRYATIENQQWPIGTIEDPRRRGAFFIEIVLADAEGALSLAANLQDGDPSVRANLSRFREGVLLLSPMCIAETDVRPLGRAVAAALAACLRS